MNKAAAALESMAPSFRIIAVSNAPCTIHRGIWTTSPMSSPRKNIPTIAAST
jgi:hypothetical protein